VLRQCFAPVLIVSTKRNSHNEKSFFIIWSHVVSQKNCTCWNKHGEEGLNELEAGYLNEGEVRHHANHDEDLDDNGLFEGNEPLFPPNVLRPEDVTNQEVRGFDDSEVFQLCTHPLN
jgi:hypothetical protein